MPDLKLWKVKQRAMVMARSVASAVAACTVVMSRVSPSRVNEDSLAVATVWAMPAAAREVSYLKL